MLIESRAARMWHEYDSEIQRLTGDQFRTDVTAQFNRDGYHFGQLRSDTAELAASAIAGVAIEPFDPHDFTPGFFSSQAGSKNVKAIRRASVFRRLDGNASWILADLLDELKFEVAECLGTPWKTLNVRAWTTPP